MIDSLKLIGLLKSKNREAISTLYDQYAPVLYGIILRLVKSPSKAEVVLEITFMRIVDEIHTYNDSVSLSTWMFCMARSSALKNIHLPESSDKSMGEEAQQTKKSQAALLDGVPVLCGKVLHQVYFEGSNLPETARILGISVDQVKIRLKAAIDHICKRNVHASF